MSPELAESVARLAEGIADGGSPALPGGDWKVREFGILDVQAVLDALAAAERRLSYAEVGREAAAITDRLLVEAREEIARLETRLRTGGLR